MPETKEKTIEYLAHVIKSAKKSNSPKPIFFLGAGASRSGNIPLASEIEKTILNDYLDNPDIEKLKNTIDKRRNDGISENKSNYAELMECLLPSERDSLLKKYIDEAKVNVTHMYLANLLNEEYIDYVLTVNFDNLMLRALAMFNIFPATYDMAILKDLTTTAFKEKSVVYLHGQNHGLWLLNTNDEMAKVKTTVPKILHSIKNQRPWVFIGYSGEDPIFEHIKDLGRFDNGLYWVTYKDNEPNTKVQQFISTPNTNAFLIKGYDSDSFMMTLNSKLGLCQPKIIDKPFSALKDILHSIVDIEDEDHFKGVKERLEIAKKQTDESINQFENTSIDSSENIEDLLIKEIIDIIISQNYDKEAIIKLEKIVANISNDTINNHLANLYLSWGTYLGTLADEKDGSEAEELYKEASSKFEQATKTKHDDHEAFFNWGTALGQLANKKDGSEAEKLYKEASSKFDQAIKIKPDDHEAFCNWGTALGQLANKKDGSEAEELYKEASSKFDQAIKIKPDYYEVFYNWGTLLENLANKKDGSEAEELYKEASSKFKQATRIKYDCPEAFCNWGVALLKLADKKDGAEAQKLYKEASSKFEQSTEIKPDYYKAFCNWGISLLRLGDKKDDVEAQEFYKEASSKFKQATKIKPDYPEAFCNWGTTLRKLADKKDGLEAEELYKEAFLKFDEALKYGGGKYNKACLYALREDKLNAIEYLDHALSNNEVSVKLVETDEDWKNLLTDCDFINILNKYR